MALDEWLLYTSERNGHVLQFEACGGAWGYVQPRARAESDENGKVIEGRRQTYNILRHVPQSPTEYHVARNQVDGQCLSRSQAHKTDGGHVYNRENHNADEGPDKKGT